MSEQQSGRASSDLNAYRTADEIIRTILDDHASSASDFSPSGELYRAIERFHANADRRTDQVHSARRDLVRTRMNRWASGSGPSSGSAMSSHGNSSSETFRRFSREPEPRSSSGTIRPGNSSGSGSTNVPSQSSVPRLPGIIRLNTRPTTAPPSPPHPPSEQRTRINSRPAAPPPQPERRTTRIRLRRPVQPEASADAGTDTGHSNDENERLRALLDFTNAVVNPHSESAMPSPPFRSQEPPEEARRFKRRKLDSGRSTSNFEAFRYGQYGQVEPGQLIMEMVSCDGGLYAEDGQSYGAENILKNDASVYCTKGPRCNIVLRHQASTVFSLTELVIKAPRSNYTSPVQEGMIFISMEANNLLARTAQYQIQYLPTSSSSRRLAERERVHLQSLSSRMRARHDEARARQDEDPSLTRAQARARRLYNIGLDDEENENQYPRIAQLPSDFTVTPAPFRVTTECSDDEGDDATSRADWRIGSLPFESDDSSGDDNFPRLDNLRRPSERGTRTPEAPATEAGSHAAGGDMLAPLARFFIERDKSKCTIRFDPPVSGRFLLLKMWNPSRDPATNIDVQAVVATGFAGPRYFPSIELR